MTFLWQTAVPFGTPVEPDVKSIYKRSVSTQDSLTFCKACAFFSCFCASSIKTYGIEKFFAFSHVEASQIIIAGETFAKIIESENLADGSKAERLKLLFAEMLKSEETKL